MIAFLVVCFFVVALILSLRWAQEANINYTKIIKHIAKDHLEQMKMLDFVEKQASEQWRRQIPKKQPNIYHGRIAHLAFRHRKVRVRKKNINRILKGK